MLRRDAKSHSKHGQDTAGKIILQGGTQVDGTFLVIQNSINSFVTQVIGQESTVSTNGFMQITLSITLSNWYDRSKMHTNSI